MIDATGMPQTAVLLGGSSEIGLEILTRLAGRRLRAVVLGGRSDERQASAAAKLREAGVLTTHCLAVEMNDAGSIESFAAEAGALLGTVDLFVSAVGELGSAELGELSAERVAALVAVNAGGPSGALVTFAKVMVEQGYGRLVVLSSVAGQRVRRSNFVYGAAKAALDAFSVGLAEALRGSGVSVMVVRPGFVRTRMTAGMPAAPFAVGPGEVAEAVLRGLETNASVVWVPPILRGVFVILRLVPQAIFRRLPG
jgi:decaprenylphospho-beta-D-erythro-pentofuranosid-2-ulose 2-reductase